MSYYRVLSLQRGLFSSPLNEDLTYYRASGYDWEKDKNALIFTTTGSLQPGESYSTLVLTVLVDRHAASSLTPTATISGGGAPTVQVSDSTKVTK